MSSPVEFNYYPPILRKDGNVYHMPNFPTAKYAHKLGWESHEQLARARNSEVPSLLHDEPGYLTEEENQSIQMTRIRPNQKVFVNKNQDEVFTAQQMDAKTIKEELPSWVMDGILKLPKILLHRGEGKDFNKSRFEKILRSGKKGEDRVYTMGWS